eukprot:gene8444-biopygen21155
MMAAMNHHVRCPCPAITSRLARASPRAPRSHRCPPGRCMGYHQGGAMESQSADARRCSTRHSVTCCKPKHRPVCALPPQALARCPCSAVTSRMARVSPSTGCNIPFGAMPTSAVPLIRLSHARDPPTRQRPRSLRVGCAQQTVFCFPPEGLLCGKMRFGGGAGSPPLGRTSSGGAVYWNGMCPLGAAYWNGMAP